MLIHHQSSKKGAPTSFPSVFVWNHSAITNKYSQAAAPTSDQYFWRTSTTSSTKGLSRCWCAMGCPRHLLEPLGTVEGSVNEVIPSRAGLCHEVEASRRRQIQPLHMC